MIELINKFIDNVPSQQIRDLKGKWLVRNFCRQLIKKKDFELNITIFFNTYVIFRLDFEKTTKQVTSATRIFPDDAGNIMFAKSLFYHH